MYLEKKSRKRRTVFKLHIDVVSWCKNSNDSTNEFKLRNGGKKSVSGAAIKAAANNICIILYKRYDL